MSGFDLVGDAHPSLHRLRSLGPVVWIEEFNAWLVLTHPLANEVMRDTARFTVDHPGFSTAQVVGPSMLSLDGVEHRRHRQAFERPFRRRAVDDQFGDVVNGDVDALVEAIAPSGHGELRRSLCGPLAVAQMMVALGFHDVPVARVLGWYDAIVEAVAQVTEGHPVPSRGAEAFEELRAGLLSAINTDDGGTPSLLSTAADGLSNEDEVVSNAAVLLFGGIETTEAMMANLIYHLLTEDGLVQAVLADRSLLSMAMEESLRMEPAAAVVDRYATVDAVLGGAEIAAGDLVRVSLTAANRDPVVFNNPDRFDPYRPNLTDQVAFARGPHVCLGLHLARLETERLVWALLSRLPGIRLRPETLSLAHPVGLVFRKPEALYVEWDRPPVGRAQPV